MKLVIMDNTQNTDKNQYLENAKAKLAELKGKWEEAKAKGDMDQKQMELEHHMSDLQAKLDEMANTAEDKWEETKLGFESKWNELKAAMGM